MTGSENPSARHPAERTFTSLPDLSGWPEAIHNPGCPAASLLDAPTSGMTSCHPGVLTKMGDNDQSVYAFSASTIDRKPQSLSDFKGKVLLIVNTASECGFTPQYAGLEQLYRTYKDRGFMILGFPCNQFGAQEPGSETEILTFCQQGYGVSFPLFSKIEVNGPSAHPLYRFLKKEQRGFLGTEKIKWNFTKFLINRAGLVVARYAPSKSPKELSGKIESLLERP